MSRRWNAAGLGRRPGVRYPSGSGTPGLGPFSALSVVYVAGSPERLDVTFTDDVDPDPAYVICGAYDLPTAVTCLGASAVGNVVSIEIDASAASRGNKVLFVWEARRLADGAEMASIPAILPWVLT